MSVVPSAGGRKSKVFIQEVNCAEAVGLTLAGGLFMQA